MELFNDILASGFFVIVIWSIVILVLIWYFIRSAVRSGVKHAYFDIEEIKEKRASHQEELPHETEEKHQ